MVAWYWILIAIVAVIVIAGALWSYQQRRRSGGLKRQFGPEYEREVSTRGQRDAERELERRQRRVEALHIHALPREDRERFAEQWRTVQARFVDDPGGAISDADRLVNEVMRLEGYPIGEFEQRAADISVDHPRVVEHYRVAHDIALAHRDAKANTENLREAMVHYRSLFEDLLGERVRVAGRSEEVNS
jgi:hypothetical protein